MFRDDVIDYFNNDDEITPEEYESMIEKLINVVNR